MPDENIGEEKVPGEKLEESTGLFLLGFVVAVHFTFPKNHLSKFGLLSSSSFLPAHMMATK